ncbi:MAG: trehalose-6-phosphate synthase [Deltaproteobacteria bacterium]|nr:trehalose-6-phosphate synthase [Deltaproteobacteria bacterium]
MKRNTQRLVIVANRLPVTVEQTGNRWQAKPSSGGLVTALTPLLRSRGGMWIGWPGTSDPKANTEQLLSDYHDDTGFFLKPVPLSQNDVDRFYLGFSNEIIWPLFHDFITPCNFDPSYWEAYRRVNRRFADVIIHSLEPGDFLWVHDYHLMNVAHELRNRKVPNRIGFFLHTPFPSPDNFIKLPWRADVLRGLLQFDLVGFQTIRDHRKFLQCVRMLVDGVRIKTRGPLSDITFGRRKLRVGSFPIGIDFHEFSRGAQEPSVIARSEKIHRELPNRQIVLGVDRLDYTKGIPHRLRAFEEALKKHPELQGHVTFVQVVVPSRQIIPQYRQLKTEIEQLVSRINGQFSQLGWVPIHYFYRNLNRAELLANYRVADVALVTPLKDGMNLVAKEYCACKSDLNGALILSEFAGSAGQLQSGALLVNPFDIEGMGAAIHQAIIMSPEERRTRMRKLRRIVERDNIGRWVNDFLQAVIDRDLRHFPIRGPVPDYTPGISI